MNMDFDKIVERKGTFSEKVDGLGKHYGKDDLIPLWVADMDFESPQCVKEALQEVVNTSVYGYNTIPDEYFPTIAAWLEQEHGWKVELPWLSFIPGVVKGIGYVINFFTKPGDGIVVMPPVYPPFINVPNKNDRRLLYSPLKERRCAECGKVLSYDMDFDGLDRLLESEKPKLLILSNPHNPGGIAWSRETLARLAEICHNRGVIVISDEIHADMPLFGAKHIAFASVSDKAAQTSITFGAPSKTFNIAGIVSSYAVVPSPELREGFYRWMDVNELNSPTIFATKSAIAAYTKGGEWRTGMLEYVENNVLFVEKRLKNLKLGNVELITPLRPEFSFLIWLDCRELCRVLSLDRKGLVELFVEDAGLALNDGATFGPGGEGFMRLNVGTSVKVLEKAMARLEEAVRARL